MRVGVVEESIVSLISGGPLCDNCYKEYKLGDYEGIQNPEDPDGFAWSGPREYSSRPEYNTPENYLANPTLEPFSETGKFILFKAFLAVLFLSILLFGKWIEWERNREEGFSVTNWVDYRLHFTVNVNRALTTVTISFLLKWDLHFDMIGCGGVWFRERDTILMNRRTSSHPLYP